MCADCWSQVEPWRGAACAGCGLPFPAPEREGSEGLCGLCRRGEYDFDRAGSFGIYEGALRVAILQLKFHGREALGLRLGALLAEVWVSLAEELRNPRSVIVPVPLHRSRQRERGFNQAELLARGFRQALRRGAGGALSLETDCLERSRSTKPQTSLDLETRLANVRGAFKVRQPERVRGRQIVLIDDVMTTGATASACAAVLKRAGARSVLALTVARATPQFPDLAASARTASAGTVDHRDD